MEYTDDQKNALRVWAIGKGSGHFRRLCFACAELRKNKRAQTLSVDVDHEKAMFTCWHCEAKGAVRLDRTDRPHYQNHASTGPNTVKQRSAPKGAVRVVGTDLDSLAKSFLKGRNISEATANAFKCVYALAYFPDLHRESHGLAFPYVVNNRTQGHKIRCTADKAMVCDAPLASLCGLQLVNLDESPDMIICEGEIDMLSFYESGVMNATSVPNGAGSFGSADSHKDQKTTMAFLWSAKEKIEKAKRIIIASDADDPGIKLADELARRIGKHRCWQIEYPEGCKDANDVLMQHGAIKLKQVVEQAKPWPIEGLYEAAMFRDQVTKLYDDGLGERILTGMQPVDELYSCGPGLLTVMTGIPGHGKALALDTEIPSPDGWTTMGNIAVGDQLYDENGNVCRVIAATDIMHDRPCYKVKFDDGTEIVADADHQWLTISEKARRSAKSKPRHRDVLPRGTDQSHKRTYPSVVTTQEIASTLISQGKCNHHIQLAGAVEGCASILPIPAYTLGVWLGDGTSANGGLTCFDEEIIEWLSLDGQTITRQKTVGRFTIRSLQPKLRMLGVLNNKHIPDLYLNAGIDDRIDLLRGLMDTDGSCAIDGQCEFVSHKESLARQVHELACGLGIKAKLHGKDRKWRVMFYPMVSVFYLGRKERRLTLKNRLANRVIVSCDPVPSVAVRCIQVDSPSSLFLVTRAFVPTHNSTIVDHFMLNLARRHGQTFAICSFENPIHVHIAKLCEIMTQKHFFAGDKAGQRMTREEMQDCLPFINEHFKFLSQDDGKKATLESIMERIRTAVFRWGVSGCVIDPYNYIARPRSDDSETQFIDDMLTQLRLLAQYHGLHLWLVAHPTKLPSDGEGNYNPPRGYNISGSAAWYAKCDFGLTIYRIPGQPGRVRFINWKTRYDWMGKEGENEFLYDASTNSYLTSPMDDLHPYRPKGPVTYRDARDGNYDEEEGFRFH